MDPKDIKNQKIELLATDRKDKADEKKPFVKTFDHEHALNLLRLPKSKWQLSEESKKKFAFDGKDLSFVDEKKEK